MLLSCVHFYSAVPFLPLSGSMENADYAGILCASFCRPHLSISEHHSVTFNIITKSKKVQAQHG
jgi:hypothetical protein